MSHTFARYFFLRQRERSIYIYAFVYMLKDCLNK